MIAHSTRIRKNVKIQTLGDSTPAGVLPLIPPQRKRPPQNARGEASKFTRRHYGSQVSWGSWGSEVPKPTPALHLPDELNPLLDSFTPLVACSKIGTFSKRPMD